MPLDCKVINNKNLLLVGIILLILIFSLGFKTYFTKKSTTNSGNKDYSSSPHALATNLKIIHGDQNGIDYEIQIDRLRVTPHTIGFFTFAGLKSLYLRNIKIDIYQEKKQSANSLSKTTTSPAPGGSDADFESDIFKNISGFSSDKIAQIEGKKFQLRFMHNGQVELELQAPSFQVSARQKGLVFDQGLKLKKYKK